MAYVVFTFYSFYSLLYILIFH